MAIYIVKPWYKKSGGEKIWVPKTWSGVSSFYGRDTIIWNDTTYLFDSSNNLKLSGSTWSDSGIRTTSAISPYIQGRRAIVDSYNGLLCFYNKSRKYKAAFEAILGGYSWSSYSGSPTNASSGVNLWKTANATYYADSDGIYYKQTGTNAWTTVTWNTPIIGSRIWSDGTDIYYSYGASQNVLTNESNYTWSNKSWYGLTEFDGSNVWKDGNDIYYSNDTNHYKLNKSTNTWLPVTWTGLDNLTETFLGYYIWHDIDGKTYYSRGSDQYELVVA